MPRKTEYPDHFNDFWSKVWTPSRRLSGDSKKEGYREYLLALKAGHTPDEIRDGTEHWFELQRRKKASGEWAQSPPHLCRFLKRECHMDAYEALQEERKAIEQAQIAASNVTPIKSALPVNHFSRKWEEGRVKT